MYSQRLSVKISLVDFLFLCLDTMCSVPRGLLIYVQVFIDFTDLCFLSVALMSSYLNINYNFRKAATSTSSKMLDLDAIVHPRQALLFNIPLPYEINFCSGVEISGKGQF